MVKSLDDVLSPFVSRTQQPGFDAAADDMPCTFFVKDVRELAAYFRGRGMAMGSKKKREPELTSISIKEVRAEERDELIEKIVDALGMQIMVEGGYGIRNIHLRKK